MMSNFAIQDYQNLTIFLEKRSIIYYHKGGSWNLGEEHIILADRKGGGGGTQKIFLVKRMEHKIFK